jgi:hypothetical protein
MSPNLVAYLKEKDAKIAKLEEELAVATKRREQSGKVYDKLHPAPIISEKPEEKEEPEPPKHLFHPWDEDCPDCEAKNPEFKKETYCKACGMVLGAKEMIKTKENPKGKIDHCPNCKSEKAGVVGDKLWQRWEQIRKEIGEDIAQEKK